MKTENSTKTGTATDANTVLYAVDITPKEKDPNGEGWSKDIFLISGNGDIISPDEPVVGIGSGGSYAYAAGLALLQNTELTAEQVAVKSLEIASSICIYTNNNITLESITKE